MTDRLRLLLLLLIGCASLLLTATASAQSVDAVVEAMQAVHDQHLETVDTYIVETNRYTSYHKKIRKNGEPALNTKIRTDHGAGAGLAAKGIPSTTYAFHFGRLKKFATYKGTKTVNGIPCHVLRLRQMSDLHENAPPNVRQATYYIDADRHVPVRIAWVTESPQRARRGDDRIVVVTLKNYQETDGLMLPHRTEIELELDLSKEQRRQREQMMKNLSDKQRERMQQAMSEEQLKRLKQMTSGEPMVVTVDDVTVNTDLPDGLFN